MLLKFKQSHATKNKAVPIAAAILPLSYHTPHLLISRPPTPSKSSDCRAFLSVGTLARCLLTELTQPFTHNSCHLYVGVFSMKNVSGRVKLCFKEPFLSPFLVNRFLFKEFCMSFFRCLLRSLSSLKAEFNISRQPFSKRTGA